MSATFIPLLGTQDILSVTWLIIYDSAEETFIPGNRICRHIFKLLLTFHLVKVVDPRSTSLLGLLSHLRLVPLTS